MNYKTLDKRIELKNKFISDKTIKAFNIFNDNDNKRQVLILSKNRFYYKNQYNGCKKINYDLCYYLIEDLDNRVDFFNFCRYKLKIKK